MKNLRIPFVAAGVLALALSLSAQIAPNASVTPNPVTFGQSVTIVRDGQADAGVAYSEATVWSPDDSPHSLARAGLGQETFTPDTGPGTYWLQFRLVDNNNNYLDQWVSFTVNPSTLTARASISAATIMVGDSLMLTRDGTASLGIAETLGTVWAPDGSYDSLTPGGLGSEIYTPHSGPGVYWIQFRIFDAQGAYVDQWISFTVVQVFPTEP